jgi:hypothetical protein
MAFDPDKYLAEKLPPSTGVGFDPDKYISEKTPSAPVPEESLLDKGVHGLNTFLAPAMKSATLGKSPYIVAGGEYLRGKMGLGNDLPYSEHLANEKNFINKAGAEHPVIASAGEASGTMLPALLTGGGSVAAQAASKGGKFLNWLKGQTQNALAGAAQGSLEADPGHEVKGALTGLATSLGLGGLVTGGSKLLDSGLKNMKRLGGEFAMNAATPRIGDYNRLADQAGVGPGKMADLIKSKGEKLFENDITPSSFLKSSDMAEKINANAKKWGSIKGNLVDKKYGDEKIDFNDFFHKLSENKQIMKKNRQNPADLDDLINFLDQRTSHLVDRNGQIKLSDLDLAQQGFRDLRSKSDVLPMSGEISEPVRKEMVNTIKDKIQSINPDDAKLYSKANKEFSFYRGLQDPADITRTGAQQGTATFGKNTGDIASKAMLNPKNLAGNFGNARLAALMKYAPKVGGLEWVAGQMGKSPKEIQLMLQNEAIQSENRP